MGSMAKRCDCSQEVAGVDTWAHNSRRNSRFQQTFQRRLKAFLEVRRQCAIGWIARVQRCRKPSLRSDEVHVALHPATQCLTRLVLSRDLKGRIRASIYLGLKNGHNEIRALREMTVYRTKPDARPFRDLADRSVDS